MKKTILKAIAENAKKIDRARPPARDRIHEVEIGCSHAVYSAYMNAGRPVDISGPSVNKIYTLIAESYLGPAKPKSKRHCDSDIVSNDDVIERIRKK